MVAMAATHRGIQQGKDQKADGGPGEEHPVTAAPPSRTSRVLTTDSLATKPEMRAVAQRQSAKPRGAEKGSDQVADERQ